MIWFQGGVSFGVVRKVLWMSRSVKVVCIQIECSQEGDVVEPWNLFLFLVLYLLRVESDVI